MKLELVAFLLLVVTCLNMFAVSTLKNVIIDPPSLSRWQMGTPPQPLKLIFYFNAGLAVLSALGLVYLLMSNEQSVSPQLQ